MLEAARVLGCFSAFLLVVSVAAWAKVFREPAVELVVDSNGRTTRQAELAAQLLILACSMSALAANFAIAAWFTT